MNPVQRWASRTPATILGGLLLFVLTLPVVALVVSVTPAGISAAMSHSLFWPAITLSGVTSLISLGIVVLTGTPLAWWLATTQHRGSKVIEVLVELPIVIPPAVIGVALLQAYGRNGLLGGLLAAWGVQLPFSPAAVVMAQVVVSAPFYVTAASAAFRGLDYDAITVARTLGASPASAFFRIAAPMAAPGLIGGAALCWARSIGEFGATLLFAGSLSGVTQTTPLAIYGALQTDVEVAVVLSVVLAGCAFFALLILRNLHQTPRMWRQQ